MTPNHDPYAALRLRDFRFLAARNIASVLGNQMTAVAIGWELYQRTNSAAALGLVGFFQLIPLLARQNPPATESHPRRRVQVGEEVESVALETPNVIPLVRRPVRGENPPMDRSAILTDYKTLRSKGLELNKSLVELLSKEDIHTAARRLGVLHRNTLVLETEGDLSVLMDYALHDIFHDGLNAIGRYLRDTPPPGGSDELRILHSLQKSRHSILQVKSRIPGLGVEALEGDARTPIALVDIGFSQTAKPGKALATRLHSPSGEWHMTTGTALPVNAEVLERLTEIFADYRERHGQDPPERERAMIVIRECLRAGVSQNIQYGNAGETFDDDNPAPIKPIRRDRTKVGRNDPCPCGSGKKFKKCCGT